MLYLITGLAFGCLAGHYHGVAVTLESQMMAAQTTGAQQLTGYINMINQLEDDKPVPRR